MDRTHDAPATHARFVRWTLGAVAVALLVVGGVNWFVDPTGVTGRTTRWQVADNSSVRSSKLDLYEAALADDRAPRVLLLGSSRTMKFDPATVRRLTGAQAFNAAVSGGVPRDAWLFVQLVRERQAAGFPHLVWGLDADAFRGKQLREGLATDPRMARFVPWRDRVVQRVQSTIALTTWQTLDATIRSLRAGGARRSTRPTFDADGMQLFSRRFETREALRDEAIRRQVSNYARSVFGRDGWEHVEPDPLRDFERVVRAANDHGDVPTVFVTPYHPLAERLLAEHDLREKRDEVLERLRALQRGGDLRFELVDLSDITAFEGDAAQFYDGVHMTRANTDRVLTLLDRRGLLAPKRR